MQQSLELLNPWLVSYVEQHRLRQSRYEIDKYLIEAGYDPSEIELVWKSFEPPPPNRFSIKAYVEEKWVILIVAALILIIIIVIALGISR